MGRRSNIGAALFLWDREDCSERVDRAGSGWLSDAIEKGRKRPDKRKGEKYGDKNSRSFNEKCYENLWLCSGK